jgi:hypothetical protein
MVILFPEGIRGLTGPQIYPGLYAVVGWLFTINNTVHENNE